jgi:hypothetical protein
MFRQLVLASAATLVVGCGSGGAPTGAPTSNPPATATALPVATSLSPTAATEPAQLREGPLAAGRYTTTAFEPTFTFSLSDDWTALFSDDTDEMALEGPDGAFFAITRPRQVVDPTSSAAVAAPDDLTAWLAAHPSFKANPPEPVVVSGLDGQSIEVVPEGRGDVAVFAYRTGNMHFPSGLRIRFHVLPLDGPDMVIVVGAPEASFPDVADRAQQIIESLEITGT